MQKYILFLAFIWIFSPESIAQSVPGIEDSENYFYPHLEDFSLIGDDISRRATITEPPSAPVRPMAEWEEIDAITISWVNSEYYPALADIVKYAQKECKVYINCPNEIKHVQDTLDLFGVPYDENVIFLENQDFNTVWIRDYGPNSAYLGDVDSLIFVDWIYNRETRPEDDNLPADIADHINVPVYETVEGDFKLTATGGNFMSDGIDIGFSSKLVIEENLDKSEEEIDLVMKEFMGIDNYIKFDKLEYDGIHHIDMHMKLLDEERIMFGEYPKGEGDHDIIEANIEYLMATQKNAFGDPYEIVRIPMPPNGDDTYPGDVSGDRYFRTYTNALFINKTILVPIYEPEHDENALKIWRETMPGYNIQGIYCLNLIKAYGAIHCVTKEIGSKDPLRIVFQKIKDQDQAKLDGYPLIAKVQHRSGIKNATLYFREKGTTEYDRIEMEVRDALEDTYEASIPNFLDFGSVEYYVKAESKSGKTIARPQPAPEAYYTFDINLKTSIELVGDIFSTAAFPNPSDNLVCIPIELSESVVGELSLFDVHGKQVSNIQSGYFSAGSTKHFVNVSGYAAGLYTIRLISDKGIFSQKLIVKD